MKILPVALTTAAVGALLLVGAAPATAAGASISPGDSLYAINCDELYNDWQLLSVDPATAVSTKVGDGSGLVEDIEACAGQAAYNPATKVSYYIQWTYIEETPGVALASIDPATGASTFIDYFFFYNGDVDIPINVRAIAIDNDGAAFAIDDDNTLYSLNLATAELTEISDASICCTWAMAVDPTTNILYGIDEANGIYAIDKVSGAITNVGYVDFDSDDFRVYSLQVDSAGRFWVEADEFLDGPTLATLWSFTLADQAAVYSGIFDDDPFYTESLLIVPGKPALPATGPAESGVAVGGAVALLALGGALIAGHRIRRRTA